MQYRTQIGPALVTLATITLFHANGVIDGCPGSSHRANLSCRKMTRAYETFVGPFRFPSLHDTSTNIELWEFSLHMLPPTQYLCLSPVSPAPPSHPDPLFSAEDIMNIPIDSVWAVISVIVKPHPLWRLFLKEICVMKSENPFLCLNLMSTCQFVK